MTQIRKFQALLLLLLCSSIAQAKLNVVATIPDLGAMIEAVGGSDVTVDVIAKGTQDAHTIEPKPSYMVKISRADLVVSNGLSLEIGWLPSLLQGGRNPKVINGAKGYLDLGTQVDPIEVPKGPVTRAGGDVHPDGNPHFTLDPIRLGKLALVVADRLRELDNTHKAAYNDRAKAFQEMLEKKTKEWQERINKTGVKKVVTYHPTLNYFLNRFGIQNAGYMEPKPGIPPTLGHIIDLINLIKRENVRVVLHENIYETKYAQKLEAEVPGLKVEPVGVSVGSKPELKTNADVYEQLVKAIESVK